MLNGEKGALWLSLADRITGDPGSWGGRPCIRGMRIRGSDVLDLLDSGLSSEEVLKETPDLTLENIHVSLKSASHRLNYSIAAGQRGNCAA